MNEELFERSNGKVPRGPHKKMWARRTWVHKFTGEEITFEADNRQRCKELFFESVPEPREWRERR